MLQFSGSGPAVRAVPEAMNELYARRDQCPHGNRERRHSAEGTLCEISRESCVTNEPAVHLDTTASRLVSGTES
jgi:hypothetical protein